MGAGKYEHVGKYQPVSVSSCYDQSRDRSRGLCAAARRVIAGAQACGLLSGHGGGGVAESVGTWASTPRRPPCLTPSFTSAALWMNPTVRGVSPAPPTVGAIGARCCAPPPPPPPLSRLGSGGGPGWRRASHARACRTMPHPPRRDFSFSSLAAGWEVGHGGVHTGFRWRSWDRSS
jgi:hypothetical protein